jgi:hypothetical protein
VSRNRTKARLRTRSGHPHIEVEPKSYPLGLGDAQALDRALAGIADAEMRAAVKKTFEDFPVRDYVVESIDLDPSLVAAGGVELDERVDYEATQEQRALLDEMAKVKTPSVEGMTIRGFEIATPWGEAEKGSVKR